MTIKKELLNGLSELQLKEFAGHKGISLKLNSVKSKYYENWDEKDILVDIIADNKELTVAEIEKFIISIKT